MWQHNLGSSPGIPRPQAPNPGDWASAAQQWMKNKEFYEQWQQQQYQQHIQMMAATHAAQMAQSIDPNVINNPPPPPPLPEVKTATDASADETKSPGDSKMDQSESSRPNGTPSKFKNQHLNNNPKTALLANSPATGGGGGLKSKLPYIGKDLSKSSVFAAYDKNSQSVQEMAYWNNGTTGSQGVNADITDKSNNKQLPLWLREGLEKIKQEKQKKEVDKPKTVEPKLTIESVFGNDDDEEDSEEEQQQLSRKEQLRQQQLAESKLTSTGGGGLKNGKTQGARVTDAGKLSSQEYPTQATSASSNTKIELNDDEKQELIMSLLKQWMTDILLDVTNTEMQAVAKEVIQYAKDVRNKQQLKVTKASLNISYAADSSDNSDSDSDDSEADPKTPDEENAEFLRKRAAEKLLEYERKFHVEQDRINAELARKTTDTKKTSQRSSKRRSRSRSRRRSRSHSRSYTRSRTRSPSRRRHRRNRRDSRSRSYSRSYSRDRSRSRRRYDDSDDHDRGKKSSKSGRRSRSRSDSERRYKRRGSYRSRSDSRSRSRSRSNRKKSSKRDRHDRSRSRSRSYKKKSGKYSRRSRSISSRSSDSSRSRSRSRSRTRSRTRSRSRSPYSDRGNKSDDSRNSLPKKSKKKSKKSKK